MATSTATPDQSLSPILSLKEIQEKKTELIIFTSLILMLIGVVLAGFIVFLMVAYNFNVLQWIE